MSNYIPGGKMKVLIADDNADSRMILRQTLESAGLEIIDCNG